MPISLIMMGALVIVALFMAAKAVRVIPPTKRAVIYRLGRLVGTGGPGIVIVLPLLDTVTLIDLEPAAIAVKSGRVSALVTIRLVDARKAIESVVDIPDAIAGLAKTVIDATVARHPIEEVVDFPQTVADEVRASLDEKTAAWGIKVLGVELRASRTSGL